jgi:hypothetical protein
VCHEATLLQTLDKIFVSLLYKDVFSIYTKRVKSKLLHFFIANREKINAFKHVKLKESTNCLVSKSAWVDGYPIIVERAKCRV